MKTVASRMFAMAVGAALLGAPAFADEVTDTVEEALGHYEKQEYTEAASSLDYAAQLIRQKRGGDLQAFLPEPLEGWKGAEASSSAVGGAMLGGMVSAERKYTKGDRNVTVTIVADSPMLASLSMMFANPMFATQGGAKLQKVSGQKAIVRYDAEGKDGEVQVIVGGRYLVTAKGQSVEEADLTGYAAAVDYEGLEKKK